MPFQIMTMTDEAASEVRAAMERSGVIGLRVGIRKGGCAGMEYTVDPVTEETVRPGDDVVEHGGARLYVAPDATLFLLGTQMGYEDTLLRSGFTFQNPNQASACGCGESIELIPARPDALERARESA